MKLNGISYSTYFACDQYDLGFLAILKTALRMTRRALRMTHPDMHDEEAVSECAHLAEQEAYAMSIVVQIRALEETIRRYTASVRVLRDRAMGHSSYDPQ